MASFSKEREIGKAGYTFMGLLIAAFVLLVIVFAIQTYLLVDTLFPSDNIFMKVVTVFSFDGCCLIYAGLELFYPFKWEAANKLTGIMWGATFVGSLFCTIAYMNLSSDHLLHQIVDTNVLFVAYGLVTLVFAGDIVAITFLIKGEYVAHRNWKQLQSLPQVSTPANNQVDTARLIALAEAAEAKGYTLDKLESMLGVSSDNGTTKNAKTPRQ